jgi:hypothetical protein
MIVGYALTSKMRLPAVTATVEEARYQARKRGRSHIAATDIRDALLDYQIPSDEAMQQAFEPSERRPPKQAHVDPYSRALPRRNHLLRFSVSAKRKLNMTKRYRTP